MLIAFKITPAFIIGDLFHILPEKDCFYYFAETHKAGDSIKEKFLSICNLKQLLVSRAGNPGLKVQDWYGRIAELNLF